MAEEFTLRGSVKLDLDSSGLDAASRQIDQRRADSGPSAGLVSRGDMPKDGDLSNEIARALNRVSVFDRTSSSIESASAVKSGRGASGQVVAGVAGGSLLTTAIQRTRKSVESLRVSVDRASVRILQSRASAGSQQVQSNANGGLASVALPAASAAPVAGVAAAGIALNVGAAIAAAAAIRAVDSFVTESVSRVNDQTSREGAEFSPSLSAIATENRFRERDRAIVSGNIRGASLSRLNAAAQDALDSRNVILSNIGATVDDIGANILELLVGPLAAIAGFTTALRNTPYVRQLLGNPSATPIQSGTDLAGFLDGLLNQPGGIPSIANPVRTS